MVTVPDGDASFTSVWTIRSWVAASRAAQGLPPHVDDPVVLARVAALLAARDRTSRTSEQPRLKGAKQPVGGRWPGRASRDLPA